LLSCEAIKQLETSAIEFSLLGVEKKLPFGCITVWLKVSPARNSFVHLTPYSHRTDALNVARSLRYDKNRPDFLTQFNGRH
jgi:hypothetical protein